MAKLKIIALVIYTYISRQQYVRIIKCNRQGCHSFSETKFPVFPGFLDKIPGFLHPNFVTFTEQFDEKWTILVKMLRNPVISQKWALLGLKMVEDYISPRSGKFLKDKLPLMQEMLFFFKFRRAAFSTFWWKFPVFPVVFDKFPVFQVCGNPENEKRLIQNGFSMA